MTNEVPEGGKSAVETPLPARRFRRYGPPSSLTPEQCRRQTVVLRAACDRLFPRGSAIAFLNAHNEKLGGKPLQLALESDDGLLRVEQHLAKMGGNGSDAAGPMRS